MADIGTTIVARERTIEITHPVTGDDIGLSVTLRPQSSPEVKEVLRQHGDEDLEFAQRTRGRAGKKANAATVERRAVEHLAATISGWKWAEGVTFKGEAPAYSTEAVKKLLSDPEAHWIRKQIDIEAGDEAAFFKN